MSAEDLRALSVQRVDGLMYLRRDLPHLADSFTNEQKVSGIDVACSSSFWSRVLVRVKTRYADIGFSFNKLFSARWDDALDGLVEILGEERLAVEPTGNAIKHLHVLRKHLSMTAWRSRWSKASANFWVKAWSSFTLMFVSPLMS
jgi:hypothetical protein